MKRCSVLFALLSLLFALPATGQQLLTRAEASDYTATSTNDDVLAFCKALAEASPFVAFSEIGVTAAGYPLPMLIIGNPLPAHPVQAAREAKIVVYIQANIHGGEVEGKEAALMLSRDIAMGRHTELLGDVILLVVPNHNADGNANIDPNNRYYQGGPETGVGERTTSRNLDLNRDWMKVESPETQAVLEHIILPWDPELLIDCHTTDGSLHTEPMTWSPQLHPNGDSAMLDYAWSSLLPAAASTLQETFGHESIPYGNPRELEDGSLVWQTFGHQPRYTTNYYGLRGRLAILLETYAYADFKVRVESSYGMLLGLLRQVADDRQKIIDMTIQADARSLKRHSTETVERDAFALEVEVTARPETFVVKTWEDAERYVDENGRRNIRPVGQRVDREMQNYAHFEPIRTTPLPRCYALPREEFEAAKLLQRHGIVLHELREDHQVTALRFDTEEIQTAERLYQGHRNILVTGNWSEQQILLPAGTLIIDTAQPLGMLSAALLEPESDDGLTAWNYFDHALVGSWGRGTRPHPVLKLMSAEALPLQRLLD